MKCPECESDHITFLGIWYTRQGDVWVLMSHYGCLNCRVQFERPVDDKSFYYIKDGHTDISMRPTHVADKHETRLPIVNVAPGLRI